MVNPADWNPLIPAPVLAVIRVLDHAGYEAWLVGGCVRDLAIGRTPLDYDLSTRALPEQVLELFPRTYATGIAHGTVTVWQDDLPIEVTTFRSESDYSDNRRPDKVAFETDLQLDLSRRDFTINSMAYHPERGLFDPFGGWTDLIQRRLTTVGDSNRRFSEDALRMLRAVRLTVHYQLTPDEQLLNALNTNIHRLDLLSIERVTYELKRIIASPHGSSVLHYQNSPVLASLANRLLGFSTPAASLMKLLSGWIRPSWHPDQAVPLFFLACQISRQADHPFLAPSIGVSQVKTLRRLLSPSALQPLLPRFAQVIRLSRASSRHGHAMLYAAGLRLYLDRPEGCGPLDWARIFRVIHLNLALNTADIHRCVLDGWSLLDYILPGLPGLAADLVNLRQQVQLDNEIQLPFELPVRLSQLKISGNHPALSIAVHGPRMGLLLERLLSHVQIDPAVNTKEQLITLAGQWSFLDENCNLPAT